RAPCALPAFPTRRSSDLLYAFTPELYPTASRATGMGAAGAMARLGGLLAPSVLVHLFIQDTAMAIGLFSGLLALAAVLAWMLDADRKSTRLNSSHVKISY